MAVTIHLVGKQYVRIEDTNDVESIWRQIKSGTPIKTGRWGEEMIVNLANVTSVSSSR